MEKKNVVGIWKILPKTGFFLKYAFFFLLEIVGFGRIQLNPTRYSRIWSRSLQIWSRSRWIWLVFVGFGQIFLQLRSGSGCSGFGDVNLPLDLPVSVYENGNPPQTDQTFGLGRNRVGVGRFGRVVGLRSGLDSPSGSVTSPQG